MSPPQLTTGFIDCLFDVLHPLTLDGGFSRGPAHLFHARVGFRVIVLDDPASYSPKDPIWHDFSMGMLECFRSDALTLTVHVSSRFLRICPFIAI
ncbi:MAG: hypothetical protein DRN83_00740 [Hadesarchaea archaeon]|nr:MAG: hypothetical protein DRN83_00740 [Hadesarchaea archaeon]